MPEVVVPLLVWPALVMATSSRVLGPARWTSRHPRAALLAWTALLLSGVACVVAGLLAVVAAARALACAEPGADLGCADVLDAVGLNTLGWLLTAVVGGVGALALYRTAVILRGWRATRRRFLTMAWDEVIGSYQGVPVVAVRSRQCLAGSLPGRHPVIVVSTRMHDVLSETELSSVIAHERAHLSQHHDLISLVAELQYACTPRLACAQAFSRSIRLLIELAADDVAVRRHGAGAACSALAKVAELERDPALRLRAARLAT